MKTWNTCTCSKLTMQCHCFHHGMLCCSGSVLTWTWLPVLVRTLYIYIYIYKTWLTHRWPCPPRCSPSYCWTASPPPQPCPSFLPRNCPHHSCSGCCHQERDLFPDNFLFTNRKKNISLTKKDNSWCFDCKVHYASNTKCVKYCKMEFIKKKRKTKTAQFKHFIPYV